MCSNEVPVNAPPYLRSRLRVLDSPEVEHSHSTTISTKMIAAVLMTPVAALNLGSAVVQSNRPTGVPRCSLVHMATGLNPSSPNDRAAVAARAAAARYPVPPVYASTGSGGAMTDAEAKRKWAADRNAQQRNTQRAQSTSPPMERVAKATEGLRREYTASIGAGTIYSPPGSGGGMSDAEAKQQWSAQRSAPQRAAARQAALAAPTTAAPDAADSADVDPGADDSADVDSGADEPAAVEPAAPAAVAPASAADYLQSTTHAANARARPSLYPTQSIYAAPGSGGPMTDAEAKRKWSAQRNAEQRRAERAERDGPRSTTY